MKKFAKYYSLLLMFICMSTSATAKAVDGNPASHAQPVAFAAILKDKAAAQKAIAKINKQSNPLKNAGIEHLQFFTQKIKGKAIILATLDLNESAPSKLADEAWATITGSPLFKANFTALEQAVQAHPRQKDAKKSPWVRTETICVIRSQNAEAAKPGSPWYAAVTGLKKEKEAEYRLLHNNVWPGVIDAIGASNISRFDIFIIEFGDNEPYLFYLFQYSGKDFKADMAAQSNSPVNVRWWKFTDACQTPLPAAKDGPWLDLNPL